MARLFSYLIKFRHILSSFFSNNVSTEGYRFQGLATISSEVKVLAEKARQGKLQLHEFQVLISDISSILQIADEKHLALLLIKTFRVGLSPFLIWVCLEVLTVSQLS